MNVSFHSNPKEKQCQRMLKLPHNYTVSHASKVMLKILQVRFQQYVNRELPGVQAGFRKDRGTRDQIANNCWIIKKAREFRKNIYFCFIDYSKTFDWGVSTHSSILAWRIPWTEESGGLQSMGSQSRTRLSTQHKPLTVWITTNFGKLLRRWEYQTSDLPLEKSVCRSGNNS